MQIENTYRIISQSGRDDIRPYRCYQKQVPGSVLPRRSTKKLVIKNTRPQKANEELARKYVNSTQEKLAAALKQIFSGSIEDTKPDIVGLSFEDLYRGVENLCRYGYASSLWKEFKSQMESYLKRLREHLEEVRPNYFHSTEHEETREEIIAFGQQFVSMLQAANNRFNVTKEIYFYLDSIYVIPFDKKNMETQWQTALVDIIGPEMTRQGARNYWIHARKVIIEITSLRYRNERRLSEEQKAPAKYLSDMLRNLVSNDHSELLKEYVLDTKGFCKDITKKAQISTAHDASRFLLNMVSILERGRQTLVGFGFKLAQLSDFELEVVKAMFLEKIAIIRQFVWELTDEKYSQAFTVLVQYTALYDKDRSLFIEAYQTQMSKQLNDIGSNKTMSPKAMVKAMMELQKIVWVTTDFQSYVCGRLYAERLFQRSLILVDDPQTDYMLDEDRVSKFIEKTRDSVIKEFGSQLRSASWEPKFAENLARYMEEVMRTKTKDVPVTSKLLEHFVPAISLLKYLQSKDIFINIYKRELARRLLQNKSASLEEEEKFLSLLKEEWTGTNSMECMIKDVKKSEKINQEKPTTDGPEFKVTVLTDGNWPSYGEDSTELPPVLKEQIASFESSYAENNNHKQLKWQSQLSYCTIDARFGSETKELSMPLTLAVVLMTFESDDFMTFEDVEKHTKLSKNELFKNLSSLVFGKYKLLIKEPADRSYSPDDRYKINDDFKDKSSKLKVGFIGGKFEIQEEKVEKGESSEITPEAADKSEIERDRNDEIQAAIVRIVKDKKSISHANLIQLTKEQVDGRGKILVTTIKKNIEKLLTNLLIGRDPHCKDKYIYI